MQVTPIVQGKILKIKQETVIVGNLQKDYLTYTTSRRTMLPKALELHNYAPLSLASRSCIHLLSDSERMKN